MLADSDEATLLARNGNVVAERRGDVGFATLDRPAKLNVLTLEMIRTLATALDGWERDPEVRAVALAGTGTRAFCAGGDIERLLESARANDGSAQRFWTDQYRVDARIAAYQKPVIAFMTGIVMGGGVGLASHASHRIVTESTRLAMPETAIGLIPDVGATWLLSHAPGETGTYLALTGATVGAADAIALRLADRFVPDANVDAVKTALVQSDSLDSAKIETIVCRFVADPGEAPLLAQRATIDRAFAHDCVEDILTALDEDASEFAATAARRIRAHAPTSSKLTLRALRIARDFETMAESLRLEYRILNRLLLKFDLREGVRAVVIDKDRNPAWQPSELRDVPEEALDDYFVTLGESELRV